MTSSSVTPPPVPTQLVAERWAGWHAFKRFTVANCVSVAVLLLLMLLVFKVF